MTAELQQKRCQGKVFATAFKSHEGVSFNVYNLLDLQKRGK